MTTGGVVVAVDGGGSKTDVAIADVVTGAVVGRHRGPGCSYHELGAAEALVRIDSAVLTALAQASEPPDRVVHAGCYLTAIDLPEDEAIMTPLLADTSWGRRSLTVANDLFALLRVGTPAADAVVVVCGSGINGLAIRADGVVARVPALGRSSGDWGGGVDLVEVVLWHAARAEDGRGRPTVLRDLVLEWTGKESVLDVSAAVHRGDLDPSAWRERVPDVFAAARAGDPVARELVERQGREIGLLAAALLERLDLHERSVPVVVGGGIGTSGDLLMMGALEAVVNSRAPLAVVTPIATPPIEGAIALALAVGQDLP